MKINLTHSLIWMAVAAGSLSAQTVTVTPASLTFSALVGGTAQSQTVTVTGSSAVFAVSNVNWVKVCSGQGCAPQNSAQINSGSVTVFADPTGLSVGQYQNATAVTIDDSSLHPVATISVSLTVAPIGVSPSSLTFGYQLGSSYPTAQNLTLNSAANTQYTTSLSGSDCAWLQQPANGTSPGTVSVSVNTANLPSTAGNHSCTLQFTSGGQTVPVPVTLTVAAAPTVTVAPNPVNLFYQSGSTSSTNTASQVLTLSNPGSVALTYGIQISDPTWVKLDSNQGTIPANGSTTATVSYITSANKPVSATPYTATLGVFIPSAANNSILVPVNLTVSTQPLLMLSNAPVKFTYQVGGTIPNAQSVTATTTNAEANATTGQLQFSISAAYTSGGSWFTVPSTGTTGNTPIQISLNPSVIAGLQPGTYAGTVSVYAPFSANAPDANHAIQIPVSLKVTNDPQIVLSFSGCSMTANNGCPLNFPFETGISTAPSQVVTVTSSNSNALNTIAAAGSMTAATNCTNNWLTVSQPAAGSGNSAFTVSADPTGIPNGTTCSGTVTVTANGPSGNAAPNSPLQFPVTLYVSNAALLTVNPISLNFTAAANSGFSAFQTLNVGSTDANTSISFNAASSASWLFFDNFTHNTPFGVQVAVNTSGLTPGMTYTGNITLNSASALDSGITVPINLTVPAATMSVDQTSLSFDQTVGTAPPASKSITVKTSGADIAFVAAVSYQAGQPTGWLNATASGTATHATPATVQVSVNGANLPPGTYTGSVTITATTAGVQGSPQRVQVTLNVLPGTLSVSTNSLTFTIVQGGAAQTLPVTVTGTPGALNFTVAAASNTPNWLGVSTTTGTTPATLQVSANPAGLQPASYSGTVTVTSPNATGSPQTINVTMNVVQPQTLAVTPTTLNFTYTIGTQAPQPQTVKLTASGGSASYTTSLSSGASSWLQVSPATGTTPATLTVSVNPQGLVATTYSGVININSPSSAGTPAASIMVNLTVQAVPKPVFTAVANAASFINGPISPGENIVIFGTGLGPATLTMGHITGNAFDTTVADTQVLFDNTPSPIYYTGANQTSVMVPYGIAGRPTVSIRVSYQGVQSDPIVYSVASSAPGIYTQNVSGSGPGAINGYDLKGNPIGLNTASNPAAKGSVIAVYMTGEGSTQPAGQDGVIAPTNGTGLFKPVLPVTATIGGIPATVEYYGSAPGIIYGVMQVNVRIPDNAPSGASVPVVITVGSNSTQSGAAPVTVAVQ